MRMKPDGTGEGRMSGATKVTIAGNTIVLEDWGQSPVMLGSIKRDDKK
jgi:hypothetical protein